MREKKKTIVRKKRDEEVNEFAHEAEVQGDMSHEEAVEASAPVPAVAKEDGEAAAPQLHGKRRVGKGPKKFEQPGTNNQSRVVQEDAPEMDEGAPELEDGKPELED